MAQVLISSDKDMSTVGGGHKPEIIFQGTQLDAILTVCYCETCNRLHPTNIPNTILVEFVMEAQDGTIFSGQAAVINTKENISKLLDLILAGYTESIVEKRKQEPCTLH